MKRINIILISLLTIALASCGKQDNPKQAVRAYYNALQHEEFYEAAQVCLTANSTQQADQLRNKYSKFVKYYRILGVQQINDNEAIAVVRIKSPLYAVTGDILDMVDLTKENGKWYIGKKPNPEEMDIEEMLRAYREENPSGEAGEEWDGTELDDEEEE